MLDPRPWVPALLPTPKAQTLSSPCCYLVHTGPLSLGQTASLSSTGPLLCLPVSPKHQGPAQLLALPSPKGQPHPPSPQGCDKRPLSKALPEATTDSTPPPQGSPLQYSALENSLDHLVHGVAKSQTQLSTLKEKKKNSLTRTHAPSLLCAPPCHFS